ncbi:Dolichyl-phosphate-mannose-protein mannosyltransferase-domain-containing protein [Polychytrium aggregatum]|uniref:Dolichyl-phosphate-mannose-protein mannosyltransferase-domain-containing protein n=1 Tax=Polychytrium aggregatum TaxID=110093 RepID=UPI0022FE5D0D|nr:Dolichyl-phosphate-mannose-protein mannosyltransferase-domain-containing protein [Polychytrium aggregatum]KAI9207511.1 Dolichyl-phosphate-mannose-protein mannosyltransferase-domain-containing protein [Polychytrium aggregatum]
MSSVTHRKPKSSVLPTKAQPAFDPDSKYDKFNAQKDVGVRQNHINVVIALTIVAALIRLYRISNPSEVVFDEVHFGGFGSHYIKGEFFMDVHPPLGKLLVAASGAVAGYNGSFSFKDIGMDYVEPRVPYITMRLFQGILGVLLVPIAFVTMRNLGYSMSASILSAFLVLFENGFAAQSRLILLDPMLIFFTALTVMMWTEFLIHQDRPFSASWWYSLALTGVSLGLASSVKWVGLFLIATIGVATIVNLWNVIGDESVSFSKFGRHFAARALCLIVLPVVVYALLFQVHFMVLYKSGNGNGFMSPEFQATLQGNEVPDTFRDVGYGSRVFIRHHGTGGGYLHSHKGDYPTGSKQQHITCYPFRDENSEWIIRPVLTTDEHGAQVEPNITEFTRIKHNDIIRLEHIATHKRLHTHDIRPPVTDNKEHNEVSGYGDTTFLGDANDHWRVEIIDNNEKDPYVYTLGKNIRLISAMQGCKLFSHKVKLPKWGFEQQEVTCSKKGKASLTSWRIEASQHDLLPANAPKVNYKKPGFLGKFLELHKVMWVTNAGLTSPHAYESRPNAWPGLRRGISFWTGKGGNSSQIYLLGNPFVWWIAAASYVVFIAFLVIRAVLDKRGYIPTRGVIADYFNQEFGGAVLLLSGWAFHYFPFFLMARQLFLHHYLPALYFSILLVGSLFDMVTVRFPRQVKWGMTIIIVIFALHVFRLFSPITYGTSMTRDHCESIKWRSTWDWDCNRIPLHTETHAAVVPPTSDAPSVSPTSDDAIIPEQSPVDYSSDNDDDEDEDD